MTTLLNDVISEEASLRRRLEMIISDYVSETQNEGIDGDITHNAIICALINLMAQAAKCVRNFNYSDQELIALFTWQVRQTLKMNFSGSNGFNLSIDRDLKKRIMRMDAAYEAQEAN